MMERRLQLLLDQARYERVSNEANRSGRSVAAVIRGAIDVAFPSGDAERSHALASFLEVTADPSGPAEGWTTIKAEIESHLDTELAR